MLNQQFFNNVECAVPHKCSKKEDSSKKCAQCEIGYKFIACEPMILKCGHSICKECIEKVQKGSLKCNICSADMINSDAIGSAADFLVQSFLSNLTQELSDKFMASLSLYNGILEIIYAIKKLLFIF